MKKIMLIAIAAIAAVISLCSAASAVLSDNSSAGTVSLESSAVPALNCTMSISRAEDIIHLLPESITSLCKQEYVTVKGKCRNHSNFKYEGVNISLAGTDPSLNITFSVPGYKVIVDNVSWTTLDSLFCMSK